MAAHTYATLTAPAAPLCLPSNSLPFCGPARPGPARFFPLFLRSSPFFCRPLALRCATRRDATLRCGVVRCPPHAFRHATPCGTARHAYGTQGFLPDLKKILGFLPSHAQGRQSLLFTATMPAEVKQFCSVVLKQQHKVRSGACLRACGRAGVRACRPTDGPTDGRTDECVYACMHAC